MMSSLPNALIPSVRLSSNSKLRKRTLRKKADIDITRNEGSIDIVTSLSNIPYATNANGELIPGVLVYIMEGVMPLIKV